MKGRRWRWRLLAILAAAVLLMVALDVRMRPLVREYAVNRAKMLAGETLATAVNAVLDSGAYPYDELVAVTRGADGSVLSAETNATIVNRLSAAILTSLGETLQRDDCATMRFPLFNATGSTFLMGRGPTISLRIQQNGAATTRMTSAFSEAGINQTVHRLELTVTFRAVVLAAGFSEPIETEGTFLVAETIIVGTVPEVVANIDR